MTVEYERFIEDHLLVVLYYVEVALISDSMQRYGKFLRIPRKIEKIILKKGVILAMTFLNSVQLHLGGAIGG